LIRKTSGFEARGSPDTSINQDRDGQQKDYPEDPGSEFGETSTSCEVEDTTQDQNEARK